MVLDVTRLSYTVRHIMEVCHPRLTAGDHPVFIGVVRGVGETCPADEIDGDDG